MLGDFTWAKKKIKSMLPSTRRQAPRTRKEEQETKKTDVGGPFSVVERCPILPYMRELYDVKVRVVLREQKVNGATLWTLRGFR